MEAFFEKVAEANGSLSADKLRAIKQHVFNKRNKMSDKERKNRIKRFEKNIKNVRTVTKSEEPAGIDLTATMGGTITVSKLQMQHSCDACRKNPDRECAEEHCAIAAIHDEIIIRNIPTLQKLKEGWKKKCNLQQKRHYLKKHELGVIAQDGDKAKQGLDAGQIKEIKPQSDKMKAMLVQQERLRN